MDQQEKNYKNIVKLSPDFLGRNVKNKERRRTTRKKGKGEENGRDGKIRDHKVEIRFQRNL